jgi:hypothetical protein
MFNIETMMPDEKNKELGITWFKSGSRERFFLICVFTARQ